MVGALEVVVACARRVNLCSFRRHPSTIPPSPRSRLFVGPGSLAKTHSSKRREILRMKDAARDGAFPTILLFEREGDAPS